MELTLPIALCIFAAIVVYLAVYVSVANRKVSVEGFGVTTCIGKTTWDVGCFRDSSGACLQSGTCTRGNSSRTITRKCSACPPPQRRVDCQGSENWRVGCTKVAGVCTQTGTYTVTRPMSGGGLQCTSHAAGADMRAVNSAVAGTYQISHRCNSCR